MAGPFPAPSAVVGSSPRVALAGLALRAALMVPEVVAGDAGPHGLRVTADASGGCLVGVSVIAEPDGRYAVDLCLVTRLAPLLPLGEVVRRRVRESALRLDLADRLGSVNVEFANVIDRFEVDQAPPATAAAAAPVAAGPLRTVGPATTPLPTTASPAARPTATPSPPAATPPPAAPPSATPPAAVPPRSLIRPVDPAVTEVAPPPSPEHGEEGLG